jgi:hypothetical protein
MQKPKLTQSQAEKLLTLFQQSGLTRKAFAQKHNITFSLFSHWHPRLKKQNPVNHPSFQEISFPPSVTHSASTLTLPSGAKLEFSSAHLASVITALLPSSAEKISC